MEVDLTKIYNKNKGLWIALDSNLKKVISSGRNAKKVHDNAVKRGLKTPIMFKVPKENLPYFGA